MRKIFILFMLSAVFLGCSKNGDSGNEDISGVSTLSNTIWLSNRVPASVGSSSGNLELRFFKDGNFNFILHSEFNGITGFYEFSEKGFYTYESGVGKLRGVFNFVNSVVVNKKTGQRVNFTDVPNYKEILNNFPNRGVISIDGDFLIKNKVMEALGVTFNIQ